ncbi:hypothetical protein BEI64_30690 [Eisenbergiella tayi]|jgi:hypothetical protein|nr:hypothetical protein BEI64_30690 [Eisenbergiella tayi]RJW50697.1 hypothetical protein DXB25_08055 [Lachnospiraceae bacterium OM02-31]RJW57316.1 hypothetical protein DXB24_11330 [Lachnospiraceae bacterium OM02-3]
MQNKGQEQTDMRKESGKGLFFLMAVGIVGLGLFYGATDDYGSGEIQLYHLICWVILIIALLRALELVWEPVKLLWDQAWGKVQETRKDNRSNPINEGSAAAEDSSGVVLSEEEMETAIIVPESNQRIYVERETVPTVVSVPQAVQEKKKKKKNKKKKK